MLFAIDLHEDFIDVEGVTIATVLPLQPSSVYGSKLDTPQPDGFVTDSGASLS